MSPRTARLIFIPLGIVIVATYFFMRAGGLLNWYKVPTPSMEPTIKAGDLIFASNGNDPEPGDIVCYDIDMNGTEEIWVKRLMGMPGEKMEIKDGLVFINGIQRDDPAHLYRSYIISKDGYYRHGREMEGHPHPGQISADSLMIYLTSDDLKIFDGGEKPRLYLNESPDSPDPSFYYSRNGWSLDQMGPFVIPADSCFVIGDFRGNSLDSRYLGFVAMKSIRGVVVNK